MIKYEIEGGGLPVHVGSPEGLLVAAYGGGAVYFFHKTFSKCSTEEGWLMQA